jgi:hypothetical protein
MNRIEKERIIKIENPVIYTRIEETPEVLQSVSKDSNSPIVKPQDNIELKRAFEEKFNHFNSDYFGTGGSGKQICDYCCDKAYDLEDVWNFFLPHLKDYNKICRDTLRGFRSWYNERVSSGYIGLPILLDEIEEYLKKEESLDKRSK